MPYPVRDLVHNPEADCCADTLHHMLSIRYNNSLLITHPESILALHSAISQLHAAPTPCSTS